ncbi:MAG TPA: GNAT family N-acetyltransferase [Acidimicrobiales bacterium]|nr:GNAT family N-acetyltransferase [Acidimicrobiales bacterium]
MRVERLGEHHAVDQFNSGNKVLDDWLRTHALDNQRRNLSRTFVLVDDADTVLGYYSLTMGGVTAGELPKKLGRGLPRLTIGMVLLGRLAIAETRQGEGLGRDLIVDALLRAADAGERVAARFVAVDPIDQQAVDFYTKFGFTAIPGDSGGRMYVRLDHIIEALA